MTDTTNRPDVIAKHVRNISRYEGITEGQASVLLAAAELIDRLAEALAQSERDLAEARNTALEEAAVIAREYLGNLGVSGFVLTRAIRAAKETTP